MFCRLDHGQDRLHTPVKLTSNGYDGISELSDTRRRPMVPAFSRTMPCCAGSQWTRAFISRRKGFLMSEIQTELDGAILRIAINRAHKKNALTAQMYSELATA